MSVLHHLRIILVTPQKREKWQRIKSKVNSETSAIADLRRWQGENLLAAVFIFFSFPFCIAASFPASAAVYVCVFVCSAAAGIFDADALWAVLLTGRVVRFPSAVGSLNRQIWFWQYSTGNGRFFFHLNNFLLSLRSSSSSKIKKEYRPWNNRTSLSACKGRNFDLLYRHRMCDCVWMCCLFCLLLKIYDIFSIWMLFFECLLKNRKTAIAATTTTVVHVWLDKQWRWSK